MKLESNLPKRHGILQIAPLLDVVLMLMIFFLLGSNFVQPSGIEVTTPFSPSVLPPIAEAHVITVTSGDAPGIYFNDEKVNLKTLSQRLEDPDQKQFRDVILKADKSAPYGFVIQITNEVLKHGYDLAYATRPPQN